MVKVERKLAKIKNPKISIMASILLMLVLFGASYAYFNVSLGEPNRQVAFGNGLNVEYILNADSEMSFTFNPLDMTEIGDSYVDSDPATGYVLLGNSSDKEKITCEYEIWYKPTKVFNNTAAAGNRMELALVATDDSGQNDEVILNLNGLSKDTMFKKGSITVDGLNASITQHWTFKYRHYNLKDVNQSAHMGDTFGGQIYFKANGCNEYIEPKSLATYIKNDVYNSSANQASITAATKGAGLYKHDTSLANGAGDNSYRYAGADEDVNNYVCFDGDDCTDEGNLYRIISVDNNNVTKIIKATSLGNLAWNSKTEYTAGSSAEDVAMGLTSGTTYINIWAIKQNDGSYYTSSLNDYLNGEYLIGLGAKASLVDTTTWSVGGVDDDTRQNKNVHDFMAVELANSATYKAKVGLMYVYEYGYAALPELWTSKLSKYETSLGKNWMFFLDGYPWTITRSSDTSNYSFIVLGDGCVYGYYMDRAYGVRPVFGLKSDVKLLNTGEEGIGTKSNPMIIF